MADGLRIKLMSDYGADWPLWSQGLLSPDAVPLSASLAAALTAWQSLFNDEFHWDHGWRTPQAQARYARSAPELLHRLRQELGPTVEVVLDTWPVTDPELVRWLKHRT